MADRKELLILCAILSGLTALAGIIVMATLSDKVRGSERMLMSDDILNGHDQTSPGPATRSAMLSYCRMNPTIKSASCGFGVALGALGFIFGLVFVALAVIDLVRPRWIRGSVRWGGKPSDDAPSSKAVDICRTVMAATWGFLFLICFGVMATEWSGNPLNPPTEIQNAAQSAIAFSFFSTLFWVALAVLYGLRVRAQFKSPASGPSSSDYECGEANIQVSDGEIEMQADQDEGDEAAMVYCEQLPDRRC